MKKKVVVACGGTGGHVFPGLVVANLLQQKGHDVTVWLSGRAIESASESSWKGATFSTGARQLSVATLPQLVLSVLRCFFAMRAQKPDVVLAMGSYSSLPPVLVAWLLRIPVVLHEANAVPGKAVEFLSRFATVTAISFDEAKNWLHGRCVEKTGLPVRLSLLGKEPFDEIPENQFVIFVTGGSQGAHRVNQLVVQAMTLLKQDGIDDVFVIHQSGAADEEWVRETYEKAGVKAKVAPFIREMGRAFASADLVICRAGASTCFELALVRKPALLIPLPTALRDHQHLNAVEMVRNGGADEGIQRELTGRSLMRYIANKKSNPASLEKMRAAYGSMNVAEAGLRLVELVERTARVPSAHGTP